jgi:hypothetical protein
VGVVAVDGTKIAANATHHATRSYEQIAREILEEAAEIDAAEDEHYGNARGDELPVELRVAGDRRKRLRECRRRLEQPPRKGAVRRTSVRTAPRRAKQQCAKRPDFDELGTFVSGAGHRGACRSGAAGG